LRKRIGTILICILLIVSSVVIVYPINALNVNSNTLYVGGYGPGNYTSIQDAIDNASSGDKVFVYSGTYVENIVINKTIYLRGEKKQTTIIDGGNKRGHVIKIKTNEVYICYFTIQNSGSGILDSGIYIAQQCHRNIISDNFIIDNSNGISLGDESSENKIINNLITHNFYDGIFLDSSMSNIISGNIISFNDDGIFSVLSCGNNIFKNSVFGNSKNGIAFWLGFKNHIYKNHIYLNGAYGILVSGELFVFVYNYIIEQNNISYNHYDGIYCFGRGYNIKILNNNIFSNGGPGIEIVLMSSCKIFSNNIVDNNPNAWLINLWFSILFNNYWDDWNGIKPYVISGFLFDTPWSYFDWNPAKEPFDIPLPDVP